MADAAPQEPSFTYLDKRCPLCGDRLIRSRRTKSDHLWSFFVPVRRYTCDSRICGHSVLLRSHTLDRNAWPGLGEYLRQRLAVILVLLLLTAATVAIALQASMPPDRGVGRRAVVR